jgi:hypothetical protein
MRAVHFLLLFCCLLWLAGLAVGLFFGHATEEPAGIMIQIPPPSTNLGLESATSDTAINPTMTTREVVPRSGAKQREILETPVVEPKGKAVATEEGRGAALIRHALGGVSSN